jgi:hypothetical protein
MTARSPTSIDNMFLRIPKHVQVALKAEFQLQVKTAYAKHLNDKLTAVEATVPQAALPSLPPIVPNITPAKVDQPATVTSGNNQGKQKALDDPPYQRQNITNPLAVFANATIAAFAAATAAAVATAVTTTAVTTTAAAGTSSENALEVPGTSSTNALKVLGSDSDNTDDTIPPPVFPKKGHGLTIIYGMDINNHLKSIKSDTRILIIKPEPSTPNKNYVNGIHFLATVLTITEAPVEVKNLLPQLTKNN